MAWWDATQAEALICQSTQELIPQGMSVSCGSQVKKMTKMQRFLEFGKKAEAEPRERTDDSLFSDLESVALAVEGSDLNTTEVNFVPTARCIQHTKERQLVTRSGLQRPRCCVCHLHHERAMNAPVSVKQCIKTVLQQVHHMKVDVIAGDANAAAYKYNKRQENQDLHNSSVAIMLREMRREVNTGRPFESRLRID